MRCLLELAYGKQIGQVAKNGTMAFVRGNKVRVYDPKEKAVIKTLVTNNSFTSKTKNVYNRYGELTDTYTKHQYRSHLNGSTPVSVNVHTNSRGDVTKNVLSYQFSYENGGYGIHVLTDKLSSYGLQYGRTPSGGSLESKRTFIPNQRVPDLLPHGFSELVYGC